MKLWRRIYTWWCHLLDKGRRPDNSEVSRRQLLKYTPLLALAIPFGTARLLAQRHRENLPTFQTGDILTSKMMNDIVNRLNELSREP